MSKTQDSGKRAWAVPLFAVVGGVVVSIAMGVLVTGAGKSMPVMAAVEVRVVIPPAKAAAFEPVIIQEDSWVLSDWEKSDHYAPIKGNVVAVEGRSAPIAQAPPLRTQNDSRDAIVKPVALVHDASPYANDPNVRWFNARPVRPARTMWMTVTGYTPDEQSCGDSADGLTATMHSVNTNAMRMVAADTSILPYGSLVSVPGYDDASIVPVLDCGGAIKGAKLDLLFATNAEAKQWGRQQVLITVWEYADGKPADNPRKLR